MGLESGSPPSAAAYRNRAAQLRAEAETMTDPEIRETLLEMADNYEWMAKQLDLNRRSR